jgi:hypothetical protein
LARFAARGIVGEALEQRLTLDVSRLEPGAFRSAAELVDEPDEVEIPRREELRQAAADLLAHARSGVSIAAQLESRPLVPLLRPPQRRAHVATRSQRPAPAAHTPTASKRGRSAEEGSQLGVAQICEEELA